MALEEEYLGLGKTASTFAVGLGVVAVYYGILAIWFWNTLLNQITKGNNPSI